jgi:hypothetical protein
MQKLKAVGVVLAILMALVLLYQGSQNGRYYPIRVGNHFTFIVMDTRTGTWEVDSPTQKDLNALERRISQ